MKQEKAVMTIIISPLSPYKSVRNNMVGELETTWTAEEWAPTG